ncbi:ATPase H(+)-transporting accessory protein 2-like [Pectinophora gossypiella]|uniref:Renin receptor n=1 Tax=Pectinophora gossypiella TaxID=13191 RepID=A0A1E1VYI1_PECGO|nr:ATPase H(+)-transporting accessory protein 2-like [Pectinophora gossypiella]
MTVSLLFSIKMAIRVEACCIFLLLSIIGINAAGQLAILHHPDSLKFSGSDEIRESVLKEVFSASLGLSTEQYGYWDGLYVLDPFETPEAAVEVYVDGVTSLGDFAAKTRTYPLSVDEYEPDTFESVKDRIHQRFSTDSKLVNIRLSDTYELQNYNNVFGDIKIPKVPKQTLNSLKPSVEEDYQFLSELEALKSITSAVKYNLKPDNKIDFFNFRFSSLHALSDFHGPNSLQTKEAKKLLNEAIKELNDAFVKAYEGRVVFAVVTTDVAHTRRTVRASGNLKENTVTLTDDSADYPVIFNIILWFGVVMVFTMIAVVYAIMDMDPGRDSIIYRMTSTRMKKDN